MQADRVITVARGTWKIEDARERAYDTRVIGRAEVRIELGKDGEDEGGTYIVPAVVVASQRARDLGDKFALFFHPRDERLVVVPIDSV